MPYYLHAFFKPGFEGDPPEIRQDTVGCMEIIRWHINHYGERHVLRIATPPEDIMRLENSRPQKEWRSMEYEFSLEPGNRFYIVENDPKKVRAPNGPIIWRWDEVEKMTKAA